MSDWEKYSDWEKRTKEFKTRRNLQEVRDWLFFPDANEIDSPIWMMCSATLHEVQDWQGDIAYTRLAEPLPEGEGF